MGGEPATAAFALLAVVLIGTSVLWFREYRLRLGQQRSLHREQVLARVGTSLVPLNTRADVYRAAAAAVVELGEDLPDCVGAIVLESPTGMSVVARAGTEGELAWPGGVVPFADLPPDAQEAIKQRRPVDIHDVLSLPGDHPFRSNVLHLVPLPMGVESGGVLSIGSSGRRIPGEIRQSLGALAAQVALTLQRIALSERLQALVQNSSDVIVVMSPEGRVTYVSPSVERVLGYVPAALEGSDFGLLVDADEVAAVMSILRSSQGGGEQRRVQFRVHHADGSWRHVETAHANLQGGEQPEGIVLDIRDITDNKLLEEALRHRALHDSLTALPNRALFLDRIAHALALAGRSGSDTAVMFVDLDDFKSVNDGLGHTAGDRVLIEVAERMGAALRVSDTAARLGGDEFAVLLERRGDIREVMAVADRIIESVQRPFVIDGTEVFINASIGIATSGPAETQAPDELLQRADAAMYIAKSRGKGRSELFEPAMQARAADRVQVDADLRRALESDQFELYYQPIVEIESGAVVGVEALLRWNHPVRGMVMPAHFLSIAEASGQIVPMGRWVLETACRQARAWRSEIPDAANLWVSVNVSARQLSDPALPLDISAALHDSGLPPSALMIEVTEGSAMDDSVTASLSALRALGTRIALDDFGTGYSSLGQLARLPVDTLKLDRSFLKGLTKRSAVFSLVQAMVGAGKALRMGVVIEGIETPQQVELLAGQDGLLGQGYHYARPASASAVGVILHSQRLPVDGIASNGTGDNHASRA